MAALLPFNAGRTRCGNFRALIVAALLPLSTFVLGGCQTSAATSDTALAVDRTKPQPQRLWEGDSVQVRFPGAPNLDFTQTIRRDGRISPYIISELHVAGMTPEELGQELLRRYEGNLQSNEVNVTVLSTAATVSVRGAVTSPGDIPLDRPLTAFQVVMRSGAFDNPDANTRNVVVITQEQGREQRVELDLKRVLDGEDQTPFYLQPGDIIHVPRRFTVF